MKTPGLLWVGAMGSLGLPVALLVAQALTELVGSADAWYAACLGIYLLGLGLGSAAELDTTRRETPLPGVVIRRTWLAVAAVPVVRLGYFAFLILEDNGWPVTGVVTLFCLAAAIVLATGFLAGMELALVCRSDRAGLGLRGIRWHSAGACIGAFLSVAILTPGLDLTTAGLWIAGGNAVLAIGLLRATRSQETASTTRPKMWAGLMPATVIIAMGILGSAAIQRVYTKYYYFWDLSSPLSTPDVTRAKSAHQITDVVVDELGFESDMLIDAYSTKYTSRPTHPREESLFVDGVLRFTARYEEVSTEFFAHVPIFAAGQTPERVLVIGGGDGLLVRELLKHRGIQQIDVVESNSGLLRLATSHEALRAINAASFEDARVRLHAQDPYRFLRAVRDTFDAVYLDTTYPATYHGARPTSRELLELTRARVAPDGFVVMPVAGFDTPDPAGLLELEQGEDGLLYYHTALASGFASVTPFYSNLEVDNRRAYELLATEPPEGLAGEGPEVLARRVEFVNEHVASLLQPFLLMRPDARSIERYSDLGIELHVLNAERYTRAFPRRLRLPASVRRGMVHTLTDPRFPSIRWWYPNPPAI